ncbi:MAG: hypothetical protein IPM56_14205 [Ignavibacteriales bacterium]|nr:MAG: hypothetical protein IPM56_14205 [Ignavibacteriales bacterium]
MLTLRSNKTLIISSVIIILILLIFILPFKFSYKIHLQGKVLPVKEWTIYKGTDARVTTVLTDNLTGINESYSVTQFDRGDAVQFNFTPGIKAGAYLNAGDTVASVYSNEIDRQIVNLKGQVASTRASLSINLSGEKQALIEQETERLNFAIRQAEEHKKILSRLKSLYERGLVSQEEYEIAQGTAELNEINIKISRATLESVETGSKPELINYFNAQVSALEKELSVLEKRFKGFTLLSPINGTIGRHTNNDTLLVLNDISSFTIIIPVNILEKKYLNLPLPFDVYLNSNKLELSGELLSIDNKVRLLNGAQIVIGTSKIEGDLNQLLPGLMVDCYVNLGSFSAYEYVKIVWERLVN